MNIIDAVILGIVEGLTEFLPISSTGHLIVVGDVLGVVSPEGHLFEIAIQLGAILAVCVLYRATLMRTACGMWRAGKEQRFARNIIFAFLPAALLGVLFHDVITELLFSPRVVAIMLLVGGIMILLIERYKPVARIQDLDNVSLRTALLIGLCQSLAMVPGVSRSGATIMGSLMFGMERKIATEFSFFLAIPTMFAATFFSLYKQRDTLMTGENLALVAIGFVTAFIVALAVVRVAVGFVSKHGFKPFAYYRIVLGTLILLTL